MTQHPQVHLDIPAAPAGCSAQVLVLLPPALFPDPSLVSASTPGVSSARPLSAPGVHNPAGWDHFELERAVGWSRREADAPRSRRGHDEDYEDVADDAFESRSQLTEAERARIRLAEQSRRGKFRTVTRSHDSGQEFRVLVSNEEDEEMAEQRRIDDGHGDRQTYRAKSSDEDGAASLAQEYRALLLDLDEAEQDRSLTLQLHARYLSARPSSSSKPAKPLLNAIVSPASSGTYAEVRYPSPRVVWRCSSQGARKALDEGAMEASTPALLPAQWAQFELPPRSVANPGRLLFPPTSRHSTWQTVQLPQPTTAHLDDVVRYTHLATLAAAFALLVLTSRAAAKVAKAYSGATGKLKSE